MREIKFRAWHKLCEVMSEPYDTTVSEIEFHNYKFKHYEQNWIYESTRKDVIELQYTGLKDVHGVEICEGDIIHHLEHNRDESGGLIDYNDEYFVVKWNDTVCGFDLMLDAYIMPKVVGNIYENKDLLATV